MRVHKYTAKICEGAMDLIHGQYQEQIRLYIPGKGLIGFRKIEEGVDFFSDTSKSLAEGEDVIRSMEDGRKKWYIGAIELPEELVLKVISSGRQFNESKKSLEADVRALNDLMNKSLA